MKASETSERYVGKVRECCNYSARSAKKFLDEADASHRQSGGKGVEQLKDVLQNDLSVFTDEIIENPFSTDQQAYVVSNLINFIFMIASAALAILAFFFFQYQKLFIIASLVFAVLALVAFFGGFGFTSKNMLCSNLLAIRKPLEDTKSRIIIEANLDAPHKRKLSRKNEVLLKGLTFFGILLLLAYGIVESLLFLNKLTFTGDNFIIYAAFPIAIFAFLPLILTRTVAINASNLGVADNLIGCYTASGILRYMSEFDLRLQNTELCVLLTDGKDNKSAGAKKFCKEFAEDLKTADTTFLCLDSLYDPESFNIQAKGRKLNRAIDVAVANAGIVATDHFPKYHKGDAKIFQKAGFDTAMISSLTDEIPAFYRNDEDNEENINVRAIEAAIKFCLEFAYATDSVYTDVEDAGNIPVLERVKNAILPEEHHEEPVEELPAATEAPVVEVPVEKAPIMDVPAVEEYLSEEPATEE